MRIKSIHIALVAAITFLVAPASASAIGMRAPPCPDGELFRMPGQIVCLKIQSTRRNKAQIVRKSNRKVFQRDQRREYTKVRNIIAEPKPFARRVTDIRSSRARRAAAFANYRKNSNVDYTARSREAQRIYHESRSR
jgi:hypothetical protein